jgi:hypothetical protein
MQFSVIFSGVIRNQKCRKTKAITVASRRITEFEATHGRRGRNNEDSTNACLNTLRREYWWSRFLMLYKPIRFKESPKFEGTPHAVRAILVCVEIAVFAAVWPLSCLRCVFSKFYSRVVVVRTWSRLPSTGGLGSTLHKPIRFRTPLKLGKNARAPVRDPCLCGYRQRSASFAATCVSVRCCPRPLYSKVRFSLGRTWNGRRDTKRLFEKTSYVESFLKTYAEFTLKPKPSAGFYLFAHYVCFSARCRPHFNIYYFSYTLIFKAAMVLRYQVTSAAGLTRGHLMTN